VKGCNIKPHEHLFSGSRVVTCGQGKPNRKFLKLLVANAHKKETETLNKRKKLKEGNKKKQVME
jgi:hypothetical protein